MKFHFGLDSLILYVIFLIFNLYLIQIMDELVYKLAFILFVVCFSLGIIVMSILEGQNEGANELS